MVLDSCLFLSSITGCLNVKRLRFWSLYPKMSGGCEKERHAKFVRILLEQFNALNFVFRGCGKTKLVLRTVLSKKWSSSGHRPRLQLVIPKLEAAYYEGYDDTWHLYYKNREQIEPICKLARSHGLFVLERNYKDHN